MKAILFTLILSALATGQVITHGVFDHALTSTRTYEDPLRDVEITVHLTGPDGRTGEALAFWDGGKAWRFRYSPTAPGEWRFRTAATDTANRGLHGVEGSFRVENYTGSNELYRRGAPKVSANGRYFVYQDGTPFFWLGDTAWNGALLSTSQEWPRYLKNRAEKRFTVIQVVMTQWRAGRADENGRTAFQGDDRISIDPQFFQRMDRKIREIGDAGLVAAPVALWALTSRDRESPGAVLPTDQAALLARYIVSRYDAFPVLWLLGGDGNYSGENVTRWQMIGRQAFPESRAHRPATLHPGGMRDPWLPYKDEHWLDYLMYQSGHGDDARKWSWNATSGPATGWKLTPPRPVIDGEINYEGHVSYQGREPVKPYAVRRAAYYSLLAAPPAGFTYGAHGIWPWHREPKVPLAHDRAGISDPWFQSMDLEGAKQMKVLHEIMASLDWWKLRPDRSLLRTDTHKEDFSDYVMAALAEDGSFALVYLPVSRSVSLDLSGLHGQVEATWIDPRSGRRLPGEKRNAIGEADYEPTSSGEDWLLLLKSIN